ncbi:MAG: DUF748 domain-containing protein [Bdellovibrionaceae bacterium]|nr:DUF748 domain-containing protein [Pseudobdellovibrionaceae bacterium]
MDRYKKSRRLSKTTIFIGAVIVLLIAARAALPVFIKNKINWFLANKMDSYTGHIEDFDLSLWRGAYQIQGLVIEKKKSNNERPILTLREADLSVSWRALFQGKILADAIFYDPVVVFADSKDESKKQVGAEDKNWDEVFNQLIPFNIESVRVVNGRIEFENRDSLKAPVHLWLSNVELDIRNIRNTSRDAEDLYANLTLTSTVQDSAKLWARGHFNLAKSFDVDAKLERVNLALFNPLFKAYGPFDVEKGSLTIDAELANNGKNLKGYVKPIIKDLNVIELKERYEKAEQTGTEIVVGVGLYLLKNSKSRSAGTVLEIKGSLADPQLDYWGAIWTAVKNSVGEPDVKPGLENRKLRK